MWWTGLLGASCQRSERIFEQFANTMQKLSRIHAVEDAMIHRERQINAELRLDGVIHDKRSFLDAASGQNDTLWRIEDGMKLIDSMSAQIR